MKKRMLGPVAAVLMSMTAVLVLLFVLSSPGGDCQRAALAAPSALSPTVTDIEPSSAPNDLDAPIVISGTDFAEGAAVQLGNATLEDVGWVSTATLTATVPWGMDPAVYTLTVENPGGDSTSMTDAFTVTQGIGVWNAGELYGGWVSEVVINPITPTTLYATSDVGLFRSRDGGESWTFQFSAFVVSHVAIDPVDPDYVYMFAPWQLYRSDDEGDNWTPLETEFPIHPDPPDDPTGLVCGGDIRPYPHLTETGTVFASKCHDDGHGNGLLRSIDHGETFTPVMEGLTDTQVTALVFHPADPDQIVVGTANGNLFVSSDGGDRWDPAGTSPVDLIRSMAFNPHEPHELWVLDDEIGHKVFKSTDANYSSWEEIIPPPEAPSWVDAGIRLSPNVSGTVYTRIGDIAYKSTDGGSTWTAFGPDDMHFAHDLAEPPGDPDTVFMADRYFALYKTVDGGATWELSNQGITAAVPHYLTVSPARPDAVYGTMQHTPGIYRGTQGGAVWQFLDEPERDFQATAADPFAPDRIFAGAGGRVCRSDDGGESWPACAELPVPAEYAKCPTYPETLRSHPSEAGLLLAGLRHWCGDWHAAPGSIYYSIDGGDTFTRAHVTQPISAVQDLAFDPVSPTVAYAGAANGFFRSTDGGRSWERSEAGPRDVNSIAVEPESPHRILVISMEGLSVSSDRGVTWETLPHHPDLFINPIQLLFAPTDPSLLYVASPTGLCRSLDGGMTWSRAAGELGHVYVRSLAAVTTTDRVILYAATPGGDLRGVEVQAVAAAHADGGLVNAGVYRYTMQDSRKVYLPLVLRTYTP